MSYHYKGKISSPFDICIGDLCFLAYLQIVTKLFAELAERPSPYKSDIRYSMVEIILSMLDFEISHYLDL